MTVFNARLQLRDNTAVYQTDSPQYVFVKP